MFVLVKKIRNTIRLRRTKQILNSNNQNNFDNAIILCLIVFSEPNYLNILISVSIMLQSFTLSSRVILMSQNILSRTVIGQINLNGILALAGMVGPIVLVIF